jgi:bacterioferritin-associated ferredoxin
VFVCICSAVTEREILSAVADGAATVEAVAEATDAGLGCGTCHDHIEDLLSGRAPCPLAARRLAAVGVPWDSALAS